MTSTFRNLFFLLISFTIAAYAQRDEAQEPVRQQSLPVSYEALPFFGVDTSKGIANVHYRIAQNYFIFLRNELESKPDEYIARGELLIELLNAENTSVAREIWPIVLKRASMPRESEQLPDIQGAVSFGVPPGAYTVIFSLDDKGSGRSFFERNKKVRVSLPRLKQLELSTPMLAYTSASKTDSVPVFIPFNRGSSMLFGGKGGYLFQIFRPNPEIPIILGWKLTGRRDFPGLEDQHFNGTQFTLVNGLLTLDQHENGISYTVQNRGAGWKTLFVPLPLEQLEPGNFKITLELKSRSEDYSTDHQFRVIWPNKPASLQNLDVAVDALRHIATEAELDEMQSGSQQHRAQAFHKFWRKRDTDTTTAYNEMLAEYYRRVDESMRRYSTQSGSDGYKTDRGRIFILYGAPTHVERSLQPGSPPREVWTYDNIKRRFVFVDRSKTGNYLLMETENL